MCLLKEKKGRKRQPDYAELFFSCSVKICYYISSISVFHARQEWMQFMETLWEKYLKLREFYLLKFISLKI